MIQPIDNLPAGVLGFEAIGELSSEDYREVLEPALAAAAADGRKLRAMFVLGPRFEGFEGGAMLEDAKLGLKSWSAWERVAIVTDKASITESIHLFGWLVPGEIKAFSVDELGAATTWITEA